MVSFPNAKINLGLDIVRRRPDGYHDIVTVFYPVNWCDVLEIVPSSGDSDTLTVTGRGCDCPPEKNLVMKAVRALRQQVDFPAVDIYLRKIIPDGAGLGGGSADASFTLKSLNELFALGFGDEKLAEIAATIGADCPFFIYNRPMLATGTGTTLEPLEVDLSEYPIAIVKPQVHVSTADAYAEVTPAAPMVPLTDNIAKPPADWGAAVKNDFEASVFKAYPEIEAVKQRLEGLGAVYASMSGSGASVFAIFDNRISESTLAVEFPGCDIFVSESGR